MKSYKTHINLNANNIENGHTMAYSITCKIEEMRSEYALIHVHNMSLKWNLNLFSISSGSFKIKINKRFSLASTTRP